MLQKVTRFYKAARVDRTLLRFTILRYAAKLIMPDYRFVWPHMDWWDNAQFNQYLEKFGELGKMNNERKWILSQLMRLTADIDGDTAECGVYHGASSWLILKMNQISDFDNRAHYIFDSFAGLSKPSDIDGVTWEEGSLSCELDVVKQNLKGFQDVYYYKGWIPDRFPEVENKIFSFVHVDVDLYEPTLDSMEFFYPRMSSGGIIVCDDYGFSSCPGATRAIDEFLLDKEEGMISLPTGGGFMIKDRRTGKDWASGFPRS